MGALKHCLTWVFSFFFLFNRLSATFCPYPAYQGSVCRVWRSDIWHWPPSRWSVSCPPPCHLKASLQPRGSRVWLRDRWRFRGNAGRWYKCCGIPKLGESYPQVRNQSPLKTKVYLNRHLNMTSLLTYIYTFSVKMEECKRFFVSVSGVIFWWMTVSIVKEKSTSPPELGKTTRAMWTRRWVCKA